MTKFYQCSNGHIISAPDNYPIEKCQVFVHGKPCKGTLSGSAGQASAEKRNYCAGSGKFAPSKGHTKGTCPTCEKEVSITTAGKYRKH